jgi:phosphotransferase system enzyme I (PtsI)
MRKGIGVSPGVAVGTAYCVNEIFVNPDTKRLAEGETAAELARYHVARDRTTADLHALYAKVASQIGPDDAAIFRVHEAILRDPTLESKIRTWIVEERQTAQAALHRLLD